MEELPSMQVHPGTVLSQAYMKPLGLSQVRIAKDIGVPSLRISQIIHGKRSITADTAMRLARYFSTSPTVWMHLQARYDLEVERAKSAKRIEREVKVLKEDTPSKPAR